MGDQVKAAGVVSRRNPTSIGLMHPLLPSGVEMLSDDNRALRWDGDTLIVHTTHIDYPYFDPYGTPQSDRMSYVETFRVADDDSRLDYTIIVTDPVMLKEPVRLARSWRWQPGVQMYEYNRVAGWEGSE